MNKRFLSVTLALGLSLSALAQSLTLADCRQMAHDNYPAIRQYSLVEQSRDYTLDNAAKAWLPHVSASAGAYAFTDIVKTNQRTEQMGLDMKNYMANASVMVRQNVYDGGQTAAQKRVASAQADVQSRQLDVTMYAINDRVEQLFFGILLLDEQLRQNTLLHNDLSTSEKTVRSMMRGGIANQTDLDAILVETLKADQQKEGLEASRQSYLRMLGVLIGKDLGAEATLVRPSSEVSPTSKDAWGQGRPELSYYASQNLLLDAQRRQLDTRLRPTVSLFGLGMVHSRMSDMVNNGVLAGGVSLSWNIGALYTRKNDIRKIELQRQMNDSQRDVFLFNNRLQNEESNGTIASLRRQIAKDEEIVRLRESIRSKSDRKVELGTESVNELVRDINAVSMARAQKAQHEVELLREMYKLKNVNGSEL